MTPFRYSLPFLLLGTIAFATAHQNSSASKAFVYNLADTLPGASSDTNAVEKGDIEASVDLQQWLVHLQTDLQPVIKKAAKKRMPVGSYTVNTRFLVEKDGSISSIIVLNDPGYGVGEGIEKIIRTAPKWTPASRNGRALRSWHTQPVTFVITEK